MGATEILALLGAATAIILSAWGLVHKVGTASFTRLETQFDRLENHTTKQDVIISNLKEENSKLYKQFGQQQLTASQQAIEIGTLQRENSTNSTRLTLAEKENTHLQARLQAAEDENKSLRHDLQMVQRELGAEQESTKALKKLVEDLQVENNKLRRRLETGEFAR